MYRFAAIIAVLFAFAPAVFAEPSNPAPPQRTSKRVITISRGTQPSKRPVTGKLTLIALPPSGIQPSSVIFYVDDKEIGKCEHRPYGVEWDSIGASDGEHCAVWKAFGPDNREIETGKVTLVVTNNGLKTPSAEPAAAAKPQMAQYSSKEHKVSLVYPAGWTVKDQSISVSKDWDEGYWLVLSTDPVAQAVYVVNIRHRMLKMEHTPESYLKSTPYLADWQQTNISGRTAFMTTAGLPSANRVVHRIQMIEGRHLWMINCIDTSGKAIDESKALVIQIAGSIKPSEAKNEEPQKPEDGEDIEE
ncbi:MAG: hypothetical protein ABFD64_12040 [Armatimonadota bacterium]